MQLMLLPVHDATSNCDVALLQKASHTDPTAQQHQQEQEEEAAGDCASVRGRRRFSMFSGRTSTVRAVSQPVRERAETIAGDQQRRPATTPNPARREAQCSVPGVVDAHPDAQGKGEGCYEPATETEPLRPKDQAKKRTNVEDSDQGQGRYRGSMPPCLTREQHKMLRRLKVQRHLQQQQQQREGESQEEKEGELEQESPVQQQEAMTTRLWRATTGLLESLV